MSIYNVSSQVSQLDEIDYNTITPTDFDAFKYSATQALDKSPVAWIDRQLWRVRGDDGTTIDPEEANKKYSIPGYLTFDEPVNENWARTLAFQKQQEQERDFLINSANSKISAFAGGLVGGFIDPIVLATSLVPVARLSSIGRGAMLSLESRAAVVAGKAMFIPGAEIGAGRALATRAAIGAVEGAAGMAMFQPIQYVMNKAEKEDYDMDTFIGNVLTGALFGSVLHTALGTAGEIFARIGSRERSILNGIDASLIENGKSPVTKTGVMSSDPAISFQADHGKRMQYEQVVNAMNGKEEGFKNVLENFVDRVKQQEPVKELPEQYRATLSQETRNVIDAIDSIKTYDLKDPNVRKAIFNELNSDSIENANAQLRASLLEVEKSNLSPEIKAEIKASVESKLQELSDISDVVKTRNDFYKELKLESAEKLKTAIANSQQFVKPDEVKFDREASLKQSDVPVSDQEKFYQMGDELDNDVNVQKGLKQEQIAPELEQVVAVKEMEAKLPKYEKAMSSLADCLLKVLV